MPGQKRQAVIFIPEIQRLAHAGGILIYKTERAIVAAHADFQRLQLDAQRVIGIFFDIINNNFAVALDLQLDQVIGDQVAIIQNIVDPLAVDFAQPVSRPDADFLGNAARLNGLDFNHICIE